MLACVPRRGPATDELKALQEAGPERDQVLGRLFESHRRRLLKMIHLRMDPRLRERVGASDVLQDAYMEISARVGDYLADPRMPFFLWLRFVTAQRLVALYRHHAIAKMRDVRRQVPIEPAPFPNASSVVMAHALAESRTSPSGNAMREEARRQVEEALDRMSPADREVLALRHFEELSNVEAAAELGIQESAASKRYLRAIKRLRKILADAGDTGSGGAA